MLAAWTIVAIFAIATLLPTLWIKRAESDADRWNRFATIFVGYSLTILCLGLYWQPPLGSVAALDKARRELSVTQPADIPCGEAVRAKDFLDRASGGQMKIEGGAFRIPGAAWRAMSAAERSAFSRMAERIVSCMSAGNKTPFRIQDVETGEVLD